MCRLDAERSSIGMARGTDAEGHLWLEQNPTKAKKWAKLAREGHDRYYSVLSG